MNAPETVLVLVPAHNEAANLPSVVADLRACCPTLEILIIDDGSTDETASLLPWLGVRWLRWPGRRGIGSAMRAGLRYAARRGFKVAVRVDADGQHGADEIMRLLVPLRSNKADVVLGSRYATSPDVQWGRSGVVRVLQRVLAFCLSALTGGRVTDATSGFCAFGSRAIQLLANRHPGGYPEPELRLLLSRNALRVVEVPVSARHRLSGRTSFTMCRLLAATARIALAMIIVPLRRAEVHVHE
jgi:glycosyltransferase involved in cell wall biosynthesis